jgi:SAM-dependent methyltransferase
MGMVNDGWRAMRRVALCVILLVTCVTACATSTRSQTPCPAASPRASAAPDEAAVRAWSHAVLDAYDRGDVRAVDTALAPGFVHFEGGAPSTREEELARLSRRKPGAPQIATRVWARERVFVRERSAVFIGQATEHAGGNDSHGGADYVGWYTLVWMPDGARWTLSLWTWQKGGVSAARDVWNDMYRNGKGFTTEPNRLLSETVRGLEPGRALVVAMGQGRNAVYLASRGWQVTGVDFADEGLRIAREAAAAKKLALEAVNADIDHYDFGVAKWDLVTMIYALDKLAWIERIKPSLKPGGLFVLEYFHRAEGSDDGFATGQLAALFKDGFDILRDEVVEDRPDWAADRATIVRFVAKKR